MEGEFGRRFLGEKNFSLKSLPALSLEEISSPHLRAGVRKDNRSNENYRQVTATLHDDWVKITL